MKLQAPRPCPVLVDHSLGTYSTPRRCTRGGRSHRWSLPVPPLSFPPYRSPTLSAPDSIVQESRAEETHPTSNQDQWVSETG